MKSLLLNYILILTSESQTILDLNSCWNDLIELGRDLKSHTKSDTTGVDCGKCYYNMSLSLSKCLVILGSTAIILMPGLRLVCIGTEQFSRLKGLLQMIAIIDSNVAGMQLRVRLHNLADAFLSPPLIIISFLSVAYIILTIIHHNIYTMQWSVLAVSTSSRFPI